jgi:hypothetical protein
MVIDCVINLAFTYSLRFFHGLKALPLPFGYIQILKDGARFWNYLPDLITILVIFIFNSIKGFTPNVN